MPADSSVTHDYLVWLSRRRVRLVELGQELAEVSQRQRRAMRPREQAQDAELRAAIAHVDNRIRQAKINARRDPNVTPHGVRPGSFDEWVRRDPPAGSGVAVFPGATGARILGTFGP